MARNKYPEVTQEKILDAAKRLFLTKGYENTTIQDIVAELGGLTKGSVYHHFKSKEDIIDAIGTRMFLASNPFDAVRARKDLNGLEKMRLAIRMNLESTERMALNRQAMPALKNSRVLAQMIETNRTVLTPLWRELIEEGNRDGSVHTQYAQELAELLPLLSDLWLAPTIFPASAQQTARKFDFLAQMLQCMGLPLFDDGLLAMAQGFFAAWVQPPCEA